MILRPYQEALAHHTTPELWKRGQKRVVWVLPTGGGKTATALTLIQRMRAADWCAVYYVAHQSELVSQPLTGLAALGVGHGVVKAGRTGDVSAGVQVCSAQTLVNRPIVPPPRLDRSPHARCVVFYDEAHRTRSNTFNAIHSRLREAFTHVYAVLMTATPYRRDGRGLSEVADALVEAATPRELVAAGWILDPEFWSRPPSERDLQHGDTDSEDGARGSFGASPRLTGDIVKTWEKHAEHHPTIVRGVNRAHARHLAERFREAGHRAEHIDGTMPERLRAALLARLAIGGRGSSHEAALDLLCAGGTILEEGFDSASSYRYAFADKGLWRNGEPPTYVPLGCFVDAAHTSSRGAWIQRVGRVTRPFTTADVESWAARGIRTVRKDRAVVLCHSGNLEEHGFLLDHEGFKLLDDRLGASKVTAYYKPPTVATCPACFAAFRRPAIACPACATPVSAPDIPEEAEGELVRAKWDPSKLPPATDAEKEAYLRKVWQIWRDQNAERSAQGRPPLSPKWPAVRYRIRFGAYPDWSMDRACARIYGA